MSALLLWGIFLLIQSHVTTTSSLGFVTHDGNKEVVTGRSPDGATAAAAEQFPLQPQGHHKVRSGYVASVRSPGDRVSRIRMDGGSEGLAPHPGDLENPTAPPKNPSDVAATVTKNKNKSDFTTRRRISKRSNGGPFVYRTHTDIDPYSDLSFGNDDNVKDKRRPLTPFDRRSTSFNHMTNSLMRSVWAPARVSNDNWRTSGRSKSAKSRQFAADNEDDASKRNWDIAMKVWG